MTNAQLNCYCDKQVSAQTPFFFFLNEAGQTNSKCCRDFISIAKVRMNSASPRQQLLSQSFLFMWENISALTVKLSRERPMQSSLQLHILYMHSWQGMSTTNISMWHLSRPQYTNILYKISCPQKTPRSSLNPLQFTYFSFICQLWVTLLLTCGQSL